MDFGAVRYIAHGSRFLNLPFSRWRVLPTCALLNRYRVQAGGSKRSNTMDSVQSRLTACRGTRNTRTNDVFTFLLHLQLFILTFFFLSRHICGSRSRHETKCASLRLFLRLEKTIEPSRNKIFRNTNLTSLFSIILSAAFHNGRLIYKYTEN